MRRALFVAALLCLALTSCYRSGSGLPTAESLELPALDGSMHHPISQEEPTVLIFTASDCPVANGYAPEIAALHGDYANRGVRFFLVNVEPDAAVADLIEHADRYRLPRPILQDRDHGLASFVGAEMTPEALVIAPGGEVLYRGRIDDQFPELGVRRSAASARELRDALDSTLAGRPIAVPRTKAVGCLIRDWSQ